MKSENTTFIKNFLEKLTKSNPLLTGSFYLGLIILFLYLSNTYASISLWLTICLLLGGIITWTLIEYIMHRYIFHIHKNIPFLKRWHDLIHGLHLKNPKNLQRLFIPLVPGAILTGILFFLFYNLLHSYAFAFIAGIITGYLYYVYVHFLVHNKPGKLYSHDLWVHHLKHHYKYPDKAFGVSSPIWDIIFGTMPPKSENTKRQFS